MRDALAVVYSILAFVLAVPGLFMGATDPREATTLLWVAFGCAVIALALTRD
jgi:hypothetical protein